jgi:hypothetical protein
MDDILNHTEPYWTSIAKVTGSIPTVVRQTFRLARLWQYSGIKIQQTNSIFNRYIQQNNSIFSKTIQYSTNQFNVQQTNSTEPPRTQVLHLLISLATKQDSIQFNSKVFLLDQKIKIHILCYK